MIKDPKSAHFHKLDVDGFLEQSIVVIYVMQKVTFRSFKKKKKTEKKRKEGK